MVGDKEKDFFWNILLKVTNFVYDIVMITCVVLFYELVDKVLYELIADDHKDCLFYKYLYEMWK